MKVYVYPADRGGCGLYRMIWPAEEAIRRGWDVSIQMPDNRNLSAVVNTETREVIDVTIPDDADVMVFQRLTNVYMSRAVEHIRRKGVAVVVDMDDDLSRVNPMNPAYKAMDPAREKKRKSDHSWLAAETACDAATLVTVSAPQLLTRYARKTPGEVVRNAVPDVYVTVPHKDNDVIGWPALLVSHFDDARMLGGSISRLQKEGFSFATIGDPGGMRGALRLTKDFIQFGPVPIEQWPYTLTQLGIGVAPLAHKTEFNKSKSWLKPLELAACGVPVVMSPGLEYLQIHERGIGVLATSPAEFYEHLRRLARDPAERLDLSEQGRAAASDLTMSKMIEGWLGAWELAYQINTEDRVKSV